MDAASTSELSVNFYQTTRRNIPEESSSYIIKANISGKIMLPEHVALMGDIRIS
jgi:hypothetical protein